MKIKQSIFTYSLSSLMFLGSMFLFNTLQGQVSFQFEEEVPRKKTSFAPTAKGELRISGGLSAFGYNVPGNTTLAVLPIVGYVDQHVNNYLSLGAYAGFRGYRQTLGVDSYNWSNFKVGAKVTVFAFPFLEEFTSASVNVPNLEPYLAVMPGVSFVSNFSYLNQNPAIGFTLPVTIGAQYYIVKPLAVFLEFGPGVFGVVTTGITLKLGKQ